jgi:hypothetical protein
MSELDTIGLL